MNNKLTTLKEILLGIDSKPASAWVYLPSDKKWDLNSTATILVSDEVPPEHEDKPDAGVPELAKQKGLIQALPVTVVQDIVKNARTQKPNATLEDLFRAFDYYYKHDAFILL